MKLIFYCYSRRLRKVDPEKSKVHFFDISGSSKFIAYTKIQIYVTGSIFGSTMSLSESITIEITKTANLKVNDPRLTRLIGDMTSRYTINCRHVI